MAQLSFEGYQPVRFGGRDCTPKINQELRLRLARLQFNTQADIDNADDILSDCFPDDKEYVKEFMDNLAPFDKQQLQAYLVGGASGIKLIRDATIEQMKGVVNGQ